MHNIKMFSSTATKPSWNPTGLKENDTEIKVYKFAYNDKSKFPIYVADNVFSKSFTDNLIEEFEQQEMYPVGVDGYCNSIEKAGSFRAMAWAVGDDGDDLSDKITQKLDQIISDKEFKFQGFEFISETGYVLDTPFEVDENAYHFLGSTPWLRFMRYKSGGMHVPHYDAPFVNENERYVTLFSWVLYLNTPNGTGGSFQFVKDRIRNIGKPNRWDRSDWTHMSNDILHDIAPVQGRLIVFPHWLCHQVQEFHGDARYIIRGDVAYGF